jgi:phenylpropionate dioxygenase-like ring-hydroxylating dioxygenase large terminal subunit
VSSELATILDALPPYDGNEAAAPMLPRQCYTSAEFFAFERDAVFARHWVCVGRADQLAEPNACFAASVAGEPLIVARGADGHIRAMGAVCQHRGHVLSCAGEQPQGLIRCPLHYWTYDLDGRLVGAPHMGDALTRLRDTVRLPRVRTELWHGFIFVNLDSKAPPLAPSLTKVEQCWDGYPEAEMVTVPPVQATTPLPWNWKIQLENFTDAYHPEFVHTGTHDFAPSVHPEGGVEFTPMTDGDNAIVRSVPMLSPDGGMMRDGWGGEAMFPPIAGLWPRQHNRLTFAMIPPNLQLMFAPGAVSYTLLVPDGAEATFASSDRVTGGGCTMGRSAGSVDGIIVSAFGDPGLAELRMASDVPVVGIAEAAMLEAAEGGRRFGVATVTPLLADVIAVRVREIGLAGHYTGIRLTAGDPFALTRDPTILIEALDQAVRQCIDCDGTEAVIIGGGPLGQAALALAPRFATPIIAPIPAAVRRLVGLIDRGRYGLNG